ncbi:iron-containing alcohol dehydrogenase [Desulfosporosinus sp.]|uniref:iron-containing alcohol dehydrogenase n=1 Tax=Desulfosporosinus sp. TaxID=157907 RepID=UPI0025C00A3C|nr:iron-containing alcohol dehydrogenase [Desulfosporosinus sp.]MBC2724358.1 iron-containing alcohol dehydrogenase [Desulfosporosinus sp.]MBC2727715.1 iron-containing alcohol dehydrogenase [Desulfosporosinus sp.]
MYKLYCRIYQSVFKVFAYILPWRKPEVIQGENSLNKLPKLIKSKHVDSVLIVTDKTIVALGLMEGLFEGLSDAGVDFVVYDQTVPNPTIDNIEDALQMYKANNCTGIVAFGGGSPIDCAKGVGARLARPKKSISKMKGVFKVLKRIPPLFAIPTTSGTGSETTIAAVITDSRTHEKYAINDTSLVPQYAVLDPVLTVNLPPHITATTGIDALTHAVEAYIGRSNTTETKQYGRDAVKLIFENIFEAYSNGKNLVARKNMQEASFLAGLAFTRAYVGYVHAIAHTLGGFYSVPHGLANAIILPYVLEYYGKSAHKSLAELADVVGLSLPGDTSEQKAIKFIEAIKRLNESMGIPNKVQGIIKSDIPLMVERALAESNPLYPVPKIMSKKDINNIYHIIKE